MSTKDKSTIEFGDFQTPKALAARVAAVLRDRGIDPKSIVEPTCGLGTFLEAALEQFPEAEKAVGVEINAEYFKAASDRCAALGHRAAIDVRLADFFRYDWRKVFLDLPEPVLVIGNPPWVTASQLGSLQSGNLPKKSNFQRHRGLDAITGKANFDIAEWMLIHLLQWMESRRGTLAMLVKQSVARKVLSHAWKEKAPLAEAGLYRFDAKATFGASVDACLLVCDLRPGRTIRRCGVYDLAAPSRVDHFIGYHRGMLLADVEAFEKHERLLRQSDASATLYRWRSGVKHDCGKVMEFRCDDGKMRNGFGEDVDIEDTYVYPMLKGSDVANGDRPDADRFMLVTQREIGEATDHIQRDAPKTWQYLQSHAGLLDARGSSIYRKRPCFSVFGVGHYTFAPWKVAICGLYKKLAFRVVGPKRGKPVVLDDTVYFVPCLSKDEAELVQEMLDSPQARQFLGAFIFWDSKRPVTSEVLGRLDLLALAAERGGLEELLRLRPENAALIGRESVGGRLF